MNLLVQILTNRAQRVLKNTDGESNRIFGLTISSAATGRVAGPASSSNFDGTGEAACCLVVVRTGVEESMEVLDEGSGRRDVSAVDTVNLTPIQVPHHSADQNPKGPGIFGVGVREAVVVIPRLSLAPRSCGLWPSRCWREWCHDCTMG